MSEDNEMQVDVDSQQPNDMLLSQVLAGIAALRTSVDLLHHENNINKIELQNLKAQVNVTTPVALTSETTAAFSIATTTSPSTTNAFTIPQLANIDTRVMQVQTAPVTSPASTPSFDYIHLATGAGETQPPCTLVNRHHSAYVEDLSTKLYPLPTFTGRPEDWPLFLVSYTDTTREFGYNNRQNLMRLQKALQGDARQAVISLLIYPDDVHKIIEELQFNFGRPEILVRSQIAQVQQVATISENNINGIMSLSNKVRNIVALFKSSNCSQQLMNPILMEQLVLKLPKTKQFEWAKYAAKIVGCPTVENFSDWLSELAKIVCLLPNSVTSMQVYSNTSTNSHVVSGNPKRVLQTTVTSDIAKPKCAYCKKEHTINECPDFRSLTLSDRWSHVKQFRLCISCLRPGHGVMYCRRKKACNMNGCKRPHNKLLHEHQSENASEPSNNAEIQHVYNFNNNKESRQLFRILPVILKGPNGSKSVYAMFDEGSSVTLLEETVAKELSLKGQSSPLTLQWYDDQEKTEQSMRVSIEISGANAHDETFVIKNVRTIKELNLPAQTLVKEAYAHITSLPIANYEDAKPVLLIGLDNCHLSVSRKLVEGGDHLPIAAETKLGWVVYGPTTKLQNNQVRVCYVRETQPMKAMLKLMEEYMSVENYGTQANNTIVESDDNIRAKRILTETTKKVNGRYETGLLWCQENVQMPNSFDMAKNRLIKVEAKMSNNPTYAKKYCEEVNKYLEKGYAQLVTNVADSQIDSKEWYLPHFGVENVNKPGKLRIVFDAAASVSNISLNKMLLKGPEHAKSLVGILFKFREGMIGVAGDIQEMFSQVKIILDDQKSQQFLWREGDSTKPIQRYVMTSMIFGAACSPCCAEYIKNRNAEEYKSIMPRGTNAVINRTYVDDLVISFNDVEEAITVVKEAITINANAGFRLRGFVSNDSRIEKELNSETINTQQPKGYNLEFKTGTERILGLHWEKSNDTFCFHFKFQKIPIDVLQDKRPPTKREMLGIIMAIYDPLGLLANITVLPKVLMQSTWKMNLTWDAHLPQELYEQWRAWWLLFKQIEDFSVPRCYSKNFMQADDIQLHVFVDASSSAYAAVAYVRIRRGAKVEVALVAAKSRVAPTKIMTIPRLELQAAVLGVRLKDVIVENLTVKIDSVVFWSDSKTVLLWVRSSTREYKQFVAVRIAEILTNTEPIQWRWLPSKLNVADDATRAESQYKNRERNRWLLGEEFLWLGEQDWPNEDALMLNTKHTLEHAEILLLKENTIKHIINFNKFSSFLKLRRTIGWILRFANNTRKTQRLRGELSATELKTAEKVVCHLVQTEAFATEIAALTKCSKVNKNSDIFHLTPYLDNKGIIRLHGRIDNASFLPEEVRRPIIMPHNHHVTALIMREYHEKLHHQNDSLIITEMRQRFWVPRIRSLLKRVKRSCTLCVRNAANPHIPLMGQLPADRLTPYLRPFSYIGVDYCGPFNVAIGRRREKRWIALFTCLNTRAIHLEIADDLSTDAFFICFRNFVNRRGTPSRVRSDNGTNFVRAKKELIAENRLFDPVEIQKVMANNNIEWIFNCPANPHAGGCWERLIRCVKRLLLGISKDHAPKLSTFTSVVIEAENIVNSRPLTDIPISPNEEEPITPNHFLLGCPNSTQTPSAETNPCLRKQWRIAQNIKDHLWKRWTKEYLPQLLARSKWFEKVQPLQEGQLVLIVDHTVSRSQWRTGRVTKVFQAADGQVRSAEVLTNHGILRRPAAKLAVLNFNESSSS